ncbi:hypothetical protein [Arthrobacter antibioticus]|uniref:hypothetical protein n=1 Tax=Arthrobacter sp. H35-MC1 TaxID=3046203 RepID=UPI0024BA099E|nr:hypothetical protein [Arthrobacter sp. H35-MC1]MDJ0316159.1 hypothetical protein [Arthrobacter sp. H35-MC1]
MFCLDLDFDDEARGAEAQPLVSAMIEYFKQRLSLAAPKKRFQSGKMVSKFVYFRALTVLEAGFA